MKEILVLAPVKEIYEKSIKIIKDRGYKNIDVVQGGMVQGLEIAREAVKKGVRIIVTRGGTYKLIKENVDIPVVEIKVSAFELIESIEKVESIDGIIGVVGYNNVVSGFDLLKKVIKYDIKKFELKNEEDIYSLVEKNKKIGIKTYIGDSNLSRIIEKLDCKGIIISSSNESILTAIQEARRIRDAIKIEKQRLKQIELITQFVNDGVIAIDEREIITFFNKSAEKIFNFKAEDIVGKRITDVIKDSTLHKQLKNPQVIVGSTQSIGKGIIATSQAPIVVDGEVRGAVSTFQDITEVQRLEYKIRRKLSESGFEAKYNFEDIIYSSDSIKECIEIAKEYSKYDSPVLITGESGVGKELFCQSIHNYGERRNGPFIAVNCAAISPTLIESEFFGYEEGAFTGARKKGKTGVFELAHNGTIFLDEISEIPKELQGRLLRVLQEKQVMRIGGDKVIPVDVKVICASNRDLREMMRHNLFRKDLYFRIGILTLDIPSLNERRIDIIKLAEHFINKYSLKHNKNPIQMDERVKTVLLNYNYEGNARELEGIIEKCVVIGSFNWLIKDNNVNEHTDEFDKGLDLRTLEQKYINKIYIQSGKSAKRACEILKIDRSTLWRKLKEINYSKI